MKHLSQYAHVQSIAKSTMSEIKDIITEGISECEIVKKAEDIMRNKGIQLFWYHGIGAFVHVGKRTVLSESGKEYRPSETAVSNNDLVTVDLSPQLSHYWGDYARTFVVIDGKAVDEEAIVEDAALQPTTEFQHGIHIEKQLHRAFTDYATPDMTFEEVYLYMNEFIQQLDYINLDFCGNLGHTIEFDKNNRKYFELGNKMKLSEASFFTFEPHIKHKNGEYGFKREDIYYFHKRELLIL
ncbi:M24 family metallopeptidase [Paenibacillus sp. GCM10027627]|uniref:M24 family metallopeptidase n=1 Tax=unclassified Paenibacillus TaxID=185978 RepID=UPI00363D4C79